VEHHHHKNYQEKVDHYYNHNFHNDNMLHRMNEEVLDMNLMMLEVVQDEVLVVQDEVLVVQDEE